MSTLRPDFNKTTKVVQPQLTRYHHAYRAPMSSEKINLEMQQLKYDIYRLTKELETCSSNISDTLSEIFDGCILDHTYNAEVTVTTIEGVDDILTRIANIERRINNLEKGL